MGTNSFIRYSLILRLRILFGIWYLVFHIHKFSLTEQYSVFVNFQDTAQNLEQTVLVDNFGTLPPSAPTVANIDTFILKQVVLPFVLLF